MGGLERHFTAEEARLFLQSGISLSKLRKLWRQAGGHRVAKPGLLRRPSPQVVRKGQ